ncbi:MAG: carbohydrate binding domain-containing protein, partial [Candidatus Peribacteraceae bacterium]|nr:carbohydrate binding domain-containing protein [Candidatus Peribacteraceae bacterium]
MLFPHVAFAATRTWDGGGSTNNWSEAANWSDDTAPTAADTALFDGTDATDVTVDTDVTVSALTVTSGYGGTLSLDSSVISGTVGDGAVQFTAADKSWLQIADASQTGLDPTGAFTLAGWVYLDSLGQDRFLVGKSDLLSTTNIEYALWYRLSDGRFRFSVSSGAAGTGISATSFGAPSLSTWYFIVAKYDPSGQTISIQVNNGTVDSVACTHAVQNTNRAFIMGVDISSSGIPYDRFHNGRMDSFSFSSRLLTADEITWLYNAGNGRVYKDIGIAGTNGSALKTNLVSWWDLGENAGTRYDSYGTNHLSQTFGNIIAPPVYGSELLTNGDFETVTSVGPPANFGTWSETVSDGNIETETTAIHAGTYSAKITSGATTGQTGARISQDVVPTAGATYRFSFWTRGDGTNAGRFRIYNGGVGDIVSTTSTNISGTNFQLVTVDFAAPAGSISISAILFAGASEGAIAYFDDVSLKQITTASINNGGFEDWTVPDMGNKVTNSGFDSDTTGWTALSSSLASVAGGYSGNALQITNE